MISALYRALVRPVLFRFDPERVHGWVMGWLGIAARSRALLALARRACGVPPMPVEAFGLRFPNPVGLAAGFDKDAEVLPIWEALGFGHIEIGTVTALAQGGNRPPRLYRLPSCGALINRMGFNNGGADAVARRLDMWRERGLWPSVPVGINIGKSRVTPLEEAAGDYLRSFRALAAHGDYFAVNVSSPNTPGLRALQSEAPLDAILARLAEANAGARKPILVKIAPDLDPAGLAAVVRVAERRGVAGLIATNTTLDHGGIPERLRREGGLSGEPLRARSTEVIRMLRGMTALPIIGVGGIACAGDAREKLDAGAILLQAYTGFIYRGPRMVAEIVSGLLPSGDGDGGAGAGR